MSTAVKIIVGIVALAAIIAGVMYYRLTQGLKLTPAELEQKYKLPASQYLDVDGIRVHYVDEGAKEAPPVVLLHASYMNLRVWDQMAAALTPQFRVIRMDLLTAGLTGPDPKNEYSTDRNLLIVDELTRKLGIDRFHLLGTSSGGTVAFRYAAEHPDRVTRLILINSAGMPRTAVTDPNRPRGTALSRWIAAQHRSKNYWYENLETNFPLIPPSNQFVQMVYDMNRKQGLNEQGLLMLKNYNNGGPQAALAKITAPTMILWGMQNPTVMHLEADVFSYWMTNAPTLVKKYPKVGHYLYLEIPDEVHRDVAAFLSGELDGELRQTQRVAVSSAPAAAPQRAAE